MPLVIGYLAGIILFMLVGPILIPRKIIDFAPNNSTSYSQPPTILIACFWPFLLIVGILVCLYLLFTLPLKRYTSFVYRIKEKKATSIKIEACNYDYTGKELE